MYYAIPAKAAQPQLAREFIELATSPEVQAEGIVQRFNWYRASTRSTCRPSWTRTSGTSCSSTSRRQDLKQNALPFPISPYFTAVLNDYERIDQ